jgi:hypothetical protein
MLCGPPQRIPLRIPAITANIENLNNRERVEHRMNVIESNWKHGLFGGTMDEKQNEIDAEPEYARENKRQLGLKSKSVQQRAGAQMDEHHQPNRPDPQNRLRRPLFRA